MKKIAMLIAFALLAVTTSQAKAQINPPGSVTIDTPMLRAAVRSAQEAFYESLDAYLIANEEANRYLGLRRYDVASYFQVSANYQYQALVNTYACWGRLEKAQASGVTTVENWLAIKSLAAAAEDEAEGAAWYALTASYVAQGNPYHRGFEAAASAYEKIELLVEVLGIINPNM